MHKPTRQGAFYMFFCRFSLHLYSGTENQCFIYVENLYRTFFTTWFTWKEKRASQLALTNGPIRLDGLMNSSWRLLGFVLTHKEVRQGA